MSTLAPDRRRLTLAQPPCFARKCLRIEHVQYLIAVVVFTLCHFGLGPSVHANEPAAPRVSGIAVRKLTTSDDKKNVTLNLEIKGDHFGTKPDVKVIVVNLENGTPTDAKVTAHDDNLIFATVILPIEKKPIKYQFRVLVAEKSAIPAGHIAITPSTSARKKRRRQSLLLLRSPMKRLRVKNIQISTRCS